MHSLQSACTVLSGFGDEVCAWPGAAQTIASAKAQSRFMNYSPK